MSAFLSSFISYLLEMIILVAIGLLGGFIGVSLRKKKNAKEEAFASADAKEASSEE